MKKTIKRLFIYGIAGCSFTGLAHAMPMSMSDSFARFSNLTITTSGDVSIIDPESSTYAEAEDDLIWDFQDHDDLSTDSVSSAVSSFGSALAQTTNTSLHAGVAASSDLSSPWGVAWASAYQSYWIYADASGLGGTVTITADYEIEQSLTTSAAGDFAGAYSIAYMAIGEWGSGSILAEAYEELGMGVENGADFVDSLSGTMTVSLWFDAGEEGWTETIAYSETYVESIPLPSSVLLIGLGLTGLWFIRRTVQNV